MLKVIIFSLLCGLFNTRSAEGKGYLIETKTAKKTPIQEENGDSDPWTVDQNLHEKENLRRRSWFGTLTKAVSNAIGGTVSQPPDPATIRFWLLTTAGNPVEVMLSAESLKEAGFNPDYPTIVISHGFTSNGIGHGLPYAKAYHKVGDYNVLTIDWQTLAEYNGLGDYIKAAENTRLVGEHSAKLIALLAENGGLKKVHLVGHSLGSHVVGFIGKKVQQLGLGKVPRITGLDPARPRFESAGPGDRLDKGDAHFVDVIHTNSGTLVQGGLSIPEVIGHMDFYPFGGLHQPGCTDDVCIGDGCSYNHIYDLISERCSHRRAVDFFLESILAQKNGNTFLAWRCDSWDKFKAGECCDLSEREAIMGQGSFKGREGKYMLNVNATEPYSMNSDGNFC